MNTAFWSALGAGVLATSVTTAGIVSVRAFEDRARRNIIYFICFAAGLLITVPILHIMPKSLGMNPSAPAFVFCGFFGMHVLNRFISVFTCPSEEGEAETAGVISIIGIAAHSLIDGVVYSVTFESGMLTGLLAALGMVFHEFPEGLIAYMLLVENGIEGKKAFVYAFLTAGATTPLGTLASYPFIADIGPALLGALLAVAAGALLYVGATHLLPEAEKKRNLRTLPALTAGIVVALAIIALK
jgi:zinc transporter ZupT